MTQIARGPAVAVCRTVGCRSFDEPGEAGTVGWVGAHEVGSPLDHPHRDSTWPSAREAAAMHFGHPDQTSVATMARTNDVELLGLDLPLA